MLSDQDIARELGYGELEVEPVNLDEQLQPCSLDIRLGEEFSRFDSPLNEVIDVRDDVQNYMEKFTVEEDEGIVVWPGEFYLASTVEKVNVPDYLEADLRGVSSVARLGIEVHQTAGLFDPGFEGWGVLEIMGGDRPVRLHPGMRIAQLTFTELDNPAKNPYCEENGNKYQGQEGATASRIHEDSNE